MKILQIFPGKVWGGAEQYVIDLSSELTKRGHEVLYLSYKSSAILNRLKGEIEINTLPFRCSLDIYSAYKLADIIKKNNIELIHIHDTKFVPIVSIAKKLSKTDVKIVLTRHIARASKTLPIFRRYFKQLHNIIFVSELSKTLWLKANSWMPLSKCNVIHNSIPYSDDRTSHITSLRDKYKVKENEYVLAFTGRVRRSKGCTVLIEALSSLKDIPFKMFFIGTCKPLKYEQHILDIAEKKGIKDRIIFYGFSNNVRSIIKEADLGIAPSIVREACPLSPMEYMQEGICVIATNNGAQPEYISSGKTGVLVSPNNHTELANAIRMLLSDNKLRTDIGKNAKHHFEKNMNYHLFVEKVIDCYK